MSEKHPWELYLMEPSMDRFLEMGNMEDVSSYLDTFLRPVEESLDHRMFRDYVILTIWYAARRCLNSVGMEPERISEALSDYLPRKVGSGYACLREYAEGIIRTVIRCRDKEKESGGRKGLTKALAYIEEHYTMEELSLNMVAEAVGFSPNYFSALFSQEMNTTFIEFVAEKRMEKARTLLKETSLRSSEIAPRIGYHDPHYFSYVFKRYNGCTPKEYRQREREEKG